LHLLFEFFSYFQKQMIVFVGDIYRLLYHTISSFCDSNIQKIDSCYIQWVSPIVTHIQVLQTGLFAQNSLKG
jgi:S-adenosylmethionine synthetase